MTPYKKVLELLELPLVFSLSLHALYEKQTKNVENQCGPTHGCIMLTCLRATTLTRAISLRFTLRPVVFIISCTNTHYREYVLQLYHETTIMPPRMRRRITTATRQEIDRQQKVLSKSINRPFDIEAGLPVSFNDPGAYDLVFKTPLTVKDTGTLYLSLLRSRHCYVFEGPMFPLYWIKQSAYAKKMAAQDSKYYEKQLNDPNSEARQAVLFGDVSARDVMVKLCDGTLDLGPHTFEVRMFIAKDERSEKKKKKDKDLKDAKEESEKPENLESPGTTEPKPTVTLPAQLNKADKKVPVPPSPAPSTSIPSPPKQSSAESTAAKETPPASSTQESKSPLAAPEKSTDKDAATSARTTSTPTPVARQRITLTNLKAKPISDPSTSESPSSSLTIPPPTIPISRPLVKVGNAANPTSAPTPATSETNQPERPISPPTVSAPPPRNDTSNMQSIENTIMIANLNAIARVDASLNSLMKIVASGNASPQQIMTFQGYIQRAREMGPQPHHAYLFPNYFQNGRYVKSGVVRDRKPKVPRDQKLTAFQEKYVHNATVLFEFAENSNFRYAFPKDAIVEVLPQTEEQIEADEKDVLFSFLWVHNQKEVDEYEAKKKEYEEFVQKKEEEKKEQERKEEERKKQEAEKEAAKEAGAEEKTQETAEDDAASTQKDGEGDSVMAEPEVKEEDTGENDEGPAPTRRLPPRRGKRTKRMPPPRKARPPKDPEMPTEPEIRFTAMSFTIHKIPTRFVPIVANSVNPVDQVQQRMKHILEVGTRTSSYYLWYQVDGKQDESLAEGIRTQLHLEEKKLNGIVVSGTGTAALSLKKRKLVKADPIKKGE